jgi:hypothetical protein
VTLSAGVLTARSGAIRDGALSASPAAVWGMLFARSVLAVALQAALAAAFLIGGAADPWRAAADWWLGSFTIVNVILLVLLRALLHREGRRLRDLYRVRRDLLRTDLVLLLAVLVIAGPLGFLPNLLLGSLLWGSAQVGGDLSFVALPIWGAVAITLTFPLLQGAAELPTYFGYVMPRLQALYGWRTTAVLVAAATLSLQHVVLPLLFDWRFVIWRAFTFLPFALWFGWALYRRPSLLPYLVIAHALLDASLPIFVLVASV